MLHWIHQHRALLWWLGSASIAMFIATLVAVPWLVARIPADYFIHAKRPPGPWAGRHPALRLAVLAAKNALGVILLIAGLLMLILPGQGLLTIFVGFLMLDFPGKYRLERRLLSLPRPLAAVNWLRRRAGREPLVPPP
jgi:hypothetical protein